MEVIVMWFVIAILWFVAICFLTLKLSMAKLEG